MPAGQVRAPTGTRAWHRRGPADNGWVGWQDAAGRIRGRVAASIFERVAGPDRSAHRAVIFAAGGERWFAGDRPIRRVHGDSSMFIGGISALLLQSLHPLAMAAVAGHSGYQGDPWGRLQRTSYFLAVTTFGRATDAQDTIQRVRSIHQRVTGTAPDGRPYAASDPHLLTWVHIAEADSFLRAHSRFGRSPWTRPGGTATSRTWPGSAPAGRSRPAPHGEGADRTDRRLPGRVANTAEARAAARFLLLNPPLPVMARPPYGLLAAAAVSLLPGWARWPLRLPHLPGAEAAVVRPAGQAVVQAIRWATAARPATEAS